MTSDKSGTHWSDAELATAAQLYQDRFVDIYGEEGPGVQRRRVMRLIAETLDRSLLSVITRFQMYGASFGRGVARGQNASAGVLAARERRRLAEAQRDLTACVFGDPPPGFSALDRKRQHGAVR